MGKIIGVLGIIAMIAMYSFSIQGKFDKIDEVAEQGNLLSLTPLSALENEILTDYPTTPEGVQDIYNELLRHIYSEVSSEESILKSVELLRMLYASELLDLNSAQDQVANILADVLLYKESKTFIVGSTIDKVVYVQDNIVKLTVTHAMTTMLVLKEYTLTIEDDRWVIYNFKDLPVEQ